jgi:putative transferase (TIGR04331 family)
LINILSELYEKWVCIQNTKKLHKKFVTNSLYLNFEDFVFNDHYDYDEIKDRYQVNIWDHFCYSLILKEFTHIKTKSLIKKKINTKELKIAQSNYKKYIDLISKIIFLFKKNYKILFLDIHNIKHDIVLFTKLKKPNIHLKLPNIIKASYNKSLRDWNIDFKKKNKFEYFISKNLPKLLPLIFIEGFKINLKQIQNLNKIKSKYYFYISSINSIKNIFLAEKYRTGSKLITVQHGGNYGQLEIYPNENLEIDNSDYFLTFGWNSKFQLNNSDHKNKIIPTSALNLGKDSFFRKKSSNIIIIVSGFRYGFQNYQSIPSISQNYKELNEIYNLINNLKPELKKKVILKFRFKDEILLKNFHFILGKILKKLKL